MIGAGFAVASILAFLIVPKFQKRRTLLMISTILIAVCLIGVSLSMFSQRAYLTLTFAILFEFAYGCFMGPVHWIYIAEILNDAQFGIVTTLHYSVGIFIALTTESMVNEWSPAGTFLFYSIINLLGFLFVFYYVKETDGLTDSEKKSLYNI